MTHGRPGLLPALLLMLMGCAQGGGQPGCQEGLSPPIQNLSCNAGTSDAPSIVGTLTNFVVAWEDNTLGNFEIFLRRSTDGGASFGPAVNVSGTSFNSGRPSVALDSSLPSNIYLAWEEATANSPNASGFAGPPEVFFARSTDGGTTFSAPVNLSNTNGASFVPTVIGALTSVYVVWEDTIGGNCDLSTPCVIFFRAASDGVNFGPISRLSAGQNLNATGAKIAAHGGRIYAVWMQAVSFDCLRTAGNCEIFFARSLNGGTTWTTPFNLSLTSENSFDPDLVIVPGAADDTVYVVWDDGATKAGEIFFRRSTDSGLNFSGTQNLSNTPTAYSSFPTLGALDSFVFATWLESVSGTTQAYVSSSADSGTNFSLPKQLSNSRSTVAFPRVTVGLTSQVAVWWEDFPNGPAEILIARSVNGGQSFSVTNLSNNRGVSSFPRMIGDGRSGAAVWVDQSLGGAAELFFRTF